MSLSQVAQLFSEGYRSAEVFILFEILRKELFENWHLGFTKCSFPREAFLFVSNERTISALFSAYANSTHCLRLSLMPFLREKISCISLILLRECYYTSICQLCSS
jgi:hypothetical protein